ncbi:MAG: polyprenyl synthetase family protein [Bdellovibrionales bacterium]|nr:polyprenyl synthetase family protein [Bdellovibrionales bacterium]
MSLDFATTHQDLINAFLKDYFIHLREDSRAYSTPLIEAMEYGVLNGGKRFRPMLCFLAGEAFGATTSQLMSFAAAVEMIHAFSLIHDDLPCMDDDDLRRGQPTTHKKFGEALALLAGDALLAEAFSLIARDYKNESAGMLLVQILARATGARGMTGGQALDMGFGEPISTLDMLKKVHEGKTGALIASAVEGAGVIARLSGPQQAKAAQFGQMVGLLFQIKDDLLDQHEDAPQKNYPQMMGVEQTSQALHSLSKDAVRLLKDLTHQWQNLEKLLIYNLERDH